MARKLRNGILLLLAAAVAFTAWMLWPRSLAGTLDLEGREIWAVIIHNDAGAVPGMDGFVVQPAGDVEGSALPAGSQQAEAVLALLDGYTWHPCWRTLTGNGALSGIGALSVSLYDAQDRDRNFKVYSGIGEIRLNDQIVRLDYFGNDAAEQLSKELAAILQDGSGVAN